MEHLIALSRKARRERQNTAGQFLRDITRVFDFLAVKAPDGLPVAVLEVQLDRLRDL